LATGVVSDGNPPLTWSETENIHWKVELTGDGSNSTPIVWGDKLFYQSAIETDKEAPQTKAPQPQADNQAQGQKGRGGRSGGGAAPNKFYKFNVVCRNRHTGALLWSKTVAEVVPHQKHHPDHGFASFTPVTDGQLIWANFGSQGLYCFDLDGNPKWQAELGPYNIRAQFGEGGSLALAGDKIVVVKDHEDQSFIVAFNKNTGKEAWKKDRDERTSWATPLVVTVQGQQQVVVNATNHTIAYNPNNGDIVWECSGLTENVIPSPVADQERVFCTSGYKGSKLLAIKLGQTGDLTGTPAIAWEVDKDTPYVPSPLCYEGKVYVCSVNKEVISCYAADSGKPYYTKQSLPELKGVYASPIGVAGRVYFVGRNGVTCVLKNADTFEVLATNTLDDKIDCSPVVIGDTLYLKGKKNLYCIRKQ
jgi:outer membrane protein assembly factor BamB